MSQVGVEYLLARGAVTNGQRLLPRAFREALDGRGGQQHWRRYPQCKGKPSKLLPSGGAGLNYLFDPLIASMLQHPCSGT